MTLGKPVLAVATHTHFDHVGGHHEFSERAVHRAEAGILSRPSRHDTVIDICVTEDTFLAYPDEAFDPDRYDIAAAPPTRVLEDGDILDLGDRRRTSYPLK
jgi:glyoxylase-like metal-dependent hydrolase (beta-lactamase superfamily II)